MDIAAKLRGDGHPARKMRLVADLVRGMNADKALYVLQFNNKKLYADKIRSLLLTAINNWQQAHPDQSTDDAILYIKAIFVDAARMLKRVQPAPQGRAHRVRKRSCHITLVIGNRNDEDAAVQTQPINQEVAQNQSKL